MNSTIVSIGILAHNEERRIARTIRSLLDQSVFGARSGELAVAHWELVIVANGCTDATVRVAEDAIRERATLVSKNKLTFAIHDIPVPGKSNAWNRYVHEFSRQDATYIVMLDADIEFNERDTVFNALRVLEENPGVHVAVDRPLKHFVRKSRPSLLERLSLRFSAERLERPAAIAGSFYCARADTLRQIWLPRGLPVEDGFIKAMVITDMFRAEPDQARIARAADASHYYEGLTSLRAIFRHEIRMVVGTTINCYLTWDFLKFATDPTGPGAGELIRRLTEHDPDWCAKYVRNEIRQRGLWVLPRGLVFHRLVRLGPLPLRRKIAKLPLALVGFLFDALVCVAANSVLRRGRGLDFW